MFYTQTKRFERPPPPSPIQSNLSSSSNPSEKERSEVPKSDGQEADRQSEGNQYEDSLREMSPNHSTVDQLRQGGLAPVENQKNSGFENVYRIENLNPQSSFKTSEWTDPHYMDKDPYHFQTNKGFREMKNFVELKKSPDLDDQTDWGRNQSNPTQYRSGMSLRPSMHKQVTSVSNNKPHQLASDTAISRHSQRNLRTHSSKPSSIRIPSDERFQRIDEEEAEQVATPHSDKRRSGHVSTQNEKSKFDQPIHEQEEEESKGDMTSRDKNSLYQFYPQEERTESHENEKSPDNQDAKGQLQFISTPMFSQAKPQEKMEDSSKKSSSVASPEAHNQADSQKLLHPLKMKTSQSQLQNDSNHDSINQDTPQKKHSVKQFVSLLNNHRKSMFFSTHDLPLIPSPPPKKENQSEVDVALREENFRRKKSQFEAQFLREVDFHHKIAFRFEKLYRLSKVDPETVEALNNEIIEVISDHSDYIRHDHMALFYCLYFCVYYNNPPLVEIFRQLISKMGITDHPQIDTLLINIDTHGIDRLRKKGEEVNTFIYHMVLYQSFNDRLRVVFNKIIRALKFIQIRDRDAHYLLKTKDFELVSILFQKFSAKLEVPGYLRKQKRLRCHQYRQYKPSFFEEILIEFKMEARVTNDYWRKFLNSPEEVYQVAKMYCKRDYVWYLLRIDLTIFSFQQVLDLFTLSIRHDSMRVAIQLYLRFVCKVGLKGFSLDVLLASFENSRFFHEEKLFFLHENFDQLDVSQLDQVVDIFTTILRQQKDNPALCQYNTVKYSLLVYLICWKIQKKNLYALITKCKRLQDFIEHALNKYLLRQEHIAQLFTMMHEPVLHLKEKKDSLDLIFEMKIQSLLKNPVIIEVLNLVLEGQYSVDPSPLNLSQTFHYYLQTEIIDMKSLIKRLWTNISTLGAEQNQRQYSLQFSVWKQCIQQRAFDETVFTCLACFAVIGYIIQINYQISQFLSHTEAIYDTQISMKQYLFMDSTEEQLDEFCEPTISVFLDLNALLLNFRWVSILTFLGFLTSAIQQVARAYLLDNVGISGKRLIQELVVSISSLLYIIVTYVQQKNPLISDMCGPFVYLTDNEKNQVDFVYNLISQSGRTAFNLQVILSFYVLCLNVLSIIVLQNMQGGFGQLIIIFMDIFDEFKNFLIMWGFPLSVFALVARYLKDNLNQVAIDFLNSSLRIFYSFAGFSQMQQYKYPVGQTSLALYLVASNWLLFGYMIAMFVMKYMKTWNNLEAVKRMTIIEFKRSRSNHRLYGSITQSFFPINIILLPLILPVVFFKSERLNDSVLKAQYGLLILMYTIISLPVVCILFPFLYFKCVVNQAYIQYKMKSRVHHFRGHRLLKVLGCFFYAPFLIIGSYFVDIITLPGLLLADEQKFEYKYPRQLENSDVRLQLHFFKVFSKMFSEETLEQYVNHRMTSIELMQMHRTKFNIVENLHDLFCRGSKNYKQALENMQEYNLSRVVTYQCSYPGLSGEKKHSIVDFPTIRAIQTEIELYNFYSQVVDEYKRREIILQETTAAGKAFSSELNSAKPGGADSRQKNELIIRKDAEVVQNKSMNGPREVTGILNNFFVNLVSVSFTNIEEQIKSHRETNLEIVLKDQLRELREARHFWQRSISLLIENQYEEEQREMQRKGLTKLAKQGRVISHTKTKVHGFMSKFKQRRASQMVSRISKDMPLVPIKPPQAAADI